MPERFELVITGSGVVRDKDGNLISGDPVETRKEVTEEEVPAELWAAIRNQFDAATRAEQGEQS